VIELADFASNKDLLSSKELIKSVFSSPTSELLEKILVLVKRHDLQSEFVSQVSVKLGLVAFPKLYFAARSLDLTGIVCRLKAQLKREKLEFVGSLKNLLQLSQFGRMMQQLGLAHKIQTSDFSQYVLSTVSSDPSFALKLPEICALLNLTLCFEQKPRNICQVQSLSQFLRTLYSLSAANEEAELAALRIASLIKEKLELRLLRTGKGGEEVEQFGEFLD